MKTIDENETSLRNAIVIVVEPGDIEYKARLLISSLRLFAGRYKNCPIWAINPRNMQGISQDTLNFFREQKVNYVSKLLNKNWYNFPFFNTVYATSFVEKILGGTVDRLIYLDSDVVCLSEPTLFSSLDSSMIAVSPSDSRNVGFQDFNSINEYWSKIIGVLQLRIEDFWFIEARLTKELTSININNGVMCTNPNLMIFGSLASYSDELSNDAEFLKILENYKEGAHYLDQAILSATIVKLLNKENVYFLPEEYNFNLNFYWKSKHVGKALDDLVFVHYHNAFYSSIWKYMFKIIEKKVFISNHLPLETGEIKKRILSLRNGIYNIFNMVIHSKSNMNR